MAFAETHPDRPFQFSVLPSVPMCSAEDVFRGGIILPRRATPPGPPKGTAKGDLRRRAKEEPCAESFLSPRRVWGCGASEKTEYRRLRSAAECSPDGKAHQRKTPSRSRLHLRLLGAVGSVPAMMDMIEIRNRQRRAGPMDGDVSPRTWKLLSLLSCKGLESAAVATATPLILASDVRVA